MTRPIMTKEEMELLDPSEIPTDDELAENAETIDESYEDDDTEAPEAPATVAADDEPVKEIAKDAPQPEPATVSDLDEFTEQKAIELEEKTARLAELKELQKALKDQLKDDLLTPDEYADKLEELSEERVTVSQEIGSLSQQRSQAESRAEAATAAWYNDCTAFLQANSATYGNNPTAIQALDQAVRVLQDQYPNRARDPQLLIDAHNALTKMFGGKTAESTAETTAAPVKTVTAKKETRTLPPTLGGVPAASAEVIGTGDPRFEQMRMARRKGPEHYEDAMIDLSKTNPNAYAEWLETQGGL